MYMEEFRVCVEDYEISNLGNCRRKCKGGTLKNIEGSISNRGYRYFQLNRNGKRINYQFHTLVACAFLGERPDGLVIDHINRDKLDNRIDNLRYVTQRDNTINSDNYRTDVLEEDTVKRRNILHRQRYAEKNGLKYRKRGTGQLVFREEYRTWRAVISVNKIRHDKTFKTKEEAETYLASVITL